MIKVTYIPALETFRIQSNTMRRMRAYQRAYKRKSFASHVAASRVAIN